MMMMWIHLKSGHSGGEVKKAWTLNKKQILKGTSKCQMIAIEESGVLS